MKLRTVLTIFLALVVNCALPSIAQEQGNWKAASKTAQSITGDVTFSSEKLTISFVGFPIAEIRPLKASEVATVFGSADENAGLGHLYRLSIPGDRRFLRKNTLCGSEETKWMATYVSGKELQVAFFSNATPPVFTVESLNNNQDLCGTYTYVR
jgi:hypothetical protein